MSNEYNPMMTWEPEHQDLPEPSIQTVNDDTAEYKDFLKYVAQKTGHCSFEQLAILYPAICQAAMEWLLVERKSVNFGFCILHPRPHRANWREILLSTFPKLGPSLLGKSRVVKEAILTSCGFFNKLFDTKLLAVARHRFITWGIDVELKRSWWRAMLRRESYLHNKLGSVEYCSYIARCIDKLKPKTLSVYLSHLRQISYPAGKLFKSRSYSRAFIAPYVPKGKVQAIRDDGYEVSVVVPRKPEEVVPKEPSEVESPNETLLGLPDLRSKTADMRIGGDKQPPGR